MPVGAAFVPFVDFLVNRLAARESWIVRGTPGAPVELPPTAAALLTPTGAVPLPSSRRLTAPLETGVFFLEGAAGDTVGALEVNFDPRETQLVRANPGSVRAALGQSTEVLGDAAFERALFRGTRRADLTGIMIAAAVLAALVEMAVASTGSGRREGQDAPPAG